MNIISNKHKKNKTGEWCKHPRPDIKRAGNKKLRKDDVEDRQEFPVSKQKKDTRYKSQRLCPFCLDDIYLQNKGKEIKQHGTCSKCGAIKIGMQRLCSHCKSNNIWRQNDNFKCKNCGKVTKEEDCGKM